MCSGARIIIFFLLLTIMAPVFSQGPVDHRPRKRILMLVSYHMTHRWTQDAVNAIIRQTKNLPWHLDFNIVEMDALRIRDRDQMERGYLSVLPRLSAGNYYDMIVTLDDDALDLVLEHYRMLPPGFPIVFCGYERYSPEMKTRYPNLTGVTQNFDTLQTIRAALKLYPESNEVIILSDCSPASLRFEADLKRTLPKLDGIAYTYINENDFPLFEILNMISKVRKRSVVVLTPWRGLYNNDYQSLPAFGIDLFNAVSKPFFVQVDTLIGYGAAGGYLTIASEHGKEAASVIRRVLISGSANHIPVVKGRNSPVFDYPQLKSSSLDFNRLPEDAILLRTPPPVWVIYRYEVFAAGALFLMFVIAAAAYFVSNYYSMKRMKTLFRSLPGCVGACDARGKLFFLSSDSPDLERRGIRFLADIPEMDNEKVLNAVKHVMESRQGAAIEYDYHGFRRGVSLAPLDRSVFHADSVIWFSFDNSELQETRGKAEHLADENSRNLTALKDLFEEYQMLLDNMPSYVMTKDIDHDFRITRCNLAYTKLLGLPYGKVIGRTEKELLAEKEMTDALWDMDRRAAEQKEPLECIQRYSGADGKIRIGSFFRKVLTRQNGRRLLFTLIADMTEQYEAKLLAEETAERFELTLHSIGDAVLTTDRHGCITMLNPVAERMMGCSSREAVGKAHEEYFRIVHYTDESPVASPVNHTLRTGETVELENHTVLLALDGRRYRIADSAAPIRDRRGQIIGAILVFRDVTAEYDKRDQLRNALLLADYGAELSLSAAFHYDMTGDKMTGTKLLPELWPMAENRLPLHWSKWVYPADQEKFEQAYQKLLEGNEGPVAIDYRSSHTGELRYFRMKASLDKSEKRFKQVVGVIQDVTELTKNTWKLKDTLELWQLMIDKIPVMIFAKKANHDFRYVQTNKFFEDFLAHSREEILGHSDYELLPGVDSAEHFREKDQAIMELGRAEEFIEKPMDGEGKRRHLKTTKMPFVGADGEPLLLGVSMDITELDNLIESERITNRVLSQVVLKNSFRENIDYIFSILAEQLKCNRITLARYDAIHDTYSLNQCWNDSCVGSLNDIPPEKVALLFRQVDSMMKENRLVIHADFSRGRYTETMQPYGTKSAITAPIYIGQKLWGLLVVAFHKERRNFSPVDESLMRSMSSLIALAQIREQQNQAITRMNYEKQMILNNIKIPIWLYDKNGRLLQANTAAGDLDCHSPADSTEAEGAPDSLSSAFPGNWNILPPPQSGIQLPPQEVRYRERDYILHSEPVYDEANRLIYLIRSAIDVTDLNAFIANEKIINFCLETFFREEDIPKAIGIVLKAVCDHMRATRCHILKFDMAHLTASGFAEYAKDGAAPVFADLKDFPFQADEPWIRTFLERSHVILCDLTDPVSLRELGSWSGIVKRHDMRSLYVAGVYLNGALWGDVGLIYEKENYLFLERDLNFLKATAHLVELMLERKQSQEQLHNALQMAQAADKAKSFFVASMSHEIRTPLNAVIGFSELLRSGEIDRKTQREYLDSIVYSGNALLQLINDVLDLSKLEADQMQILPEPVDFNELGGEVLNVFRHSASERRLELQFDVAELPVLELDKLRVRQILFNLLGNAVKFTEHGSVRLWARFIAVDDHTGTFRFGVADTGIGIAKEDCRRLMAPFVQLAGTRGTSAANNGTGLGLSISKRLAEKMGGELWIESELHKGSNFGVTLYGVRKVLHPMVASGARSSSVAGEPDGGAFSILIVDDVEMNLKVMTAMCRRCGIRRITAVSSAAEALKALDSDPSFNLVLTDMWMPELDGAALARAIRKDGRFAGLPIVAVTADTDAQDNFILSEFQEILLKPVTVEKIRKLLLSIRNPQ